ncbi:MAG: hypothetical protein Kilf2KO_44440 [Rhodospirillales bacterium]
MQTTVQIKVTYDPTARVWYILECSLPGICAEADTLEGLKLRLPDLVMDTLGDVDPSSVDIAVEIVLLRPAHEVVH